jgi:hypothetical protein
VTASDVEAAIQAAFADVPYPGDKKVKGGDSYDENLIGDIERDYQGRHWRDIALDVLRTTSRAYGGLTFMTPEAFQFYLPAFLIGGLTDDDVRDAASYALTPPPPDEPRFQKLFHEPVGLLTDGQRRAIGMWWAFLRDRGDLTDREVTNALEYWAAYLPKRSGEES